MQLEILIVAAIVFGVMTITGQLSITQLISDNQAILEMLTDKLKGWNNE